MRKIILIVLSLAFINLINAQEKKSNTNKWGVTIGWNALDVRVPTEIGIMLKDYIGFRDINAKGGRLTIERKFADKFGIQIGGAIGEFERPYEYERVTLKDKKYFNVDLKGNFYLASLFGETGWFDPFINLGIGYSSLADESDFKVNAGYGTNLWLTEKFGLKLASSYNHAFNQNGTDFFQHSVGLTYNFINNDRDKDGVKDDEDNCPDVPGLKEFNGCPDTDGDGIKDGDDRCPGVAGTKENNGCPDTDGDGVIDIKDKCPKEVGAKDNNGCPWGDKDKDGITDNLDDCPDKPGVASNKGCPEVKPEPVKVVTPEPVKSDCSAEINEINRTEIYFDFDKHYIKPSEKVKLDRIVDLLKSIKCNLEIAFISGYTDKVGTKVYNDRLSEKRAQKVQQYLRDKGVSNITIQGKGFGETTTRDQNEYNRRVQINVR